MELLDEYLQMERGAAIRRLQGSYADFCKLIEGTVRNTVRDDLRAMDASPAEQLACAKATDLRRLGYARLEAAVPREALAVPRTFAALLPERARQLSVGEQSVADPQFAGVFWGRHPSGFNTRIAFDARRPPAFMAPLLEALRLADRIVEKAIGVAGVPLERKLLVVDCLRPTDIVDYQWWHYDRLCEQYKVLVLLDDVGPGQGPMRILPGTHLFQGSRRIYDFAHYAAANHGADPGYETYRNRLQDVVAAVGRAGDAFVFDTRVFHAHGRPTQAERYTSTLYYEPPATPLNLFFRHFRPDEDNYAY